MNEPRAGFWFCPTRGCANHTMEDIERPYHGLPSEGAPPTLCEHCGASLWLVRLKVVMSDESKAKLRGHLAGRAVARRKEEQDEAVQASASGARIMVKRFSDDAAIVGYACGCGFYSPIEDGTGNRGPLLSASRARWREHECGTSGGTNAS